MINNEEFQDEIGNNHISTNAKIRLGMMLLLLLTTKKLNELKKMSKIS
jgi:GTP cyclohydrolase I